MRRLIILSIFCLQAMLLYAQPVAPRANVVPYDDDDAVAKLGYRESPYYMELSGAWRQRRTDSSIVYARNVEVAKSWKDYNVCLMVRCGHGVVVKIDGKEVGRSEDSRLWAEFKLDSWLKYGKNVALEIEALNSCTGAMLEDSTIGHGLNGEPYLAFKSDPGVEDFAIVADYDAETGVGTLNIDADIVCGKRKGRYYLEAEVWDPKGRQLDRLGRWIIFDNKSVETVELSRTWNDVKAWNAENPQLYTLVLRLRDEKMYVEEVVGAKFGFRRIEISEGQFVVNGRPITLKGMAYGIEHTEGFSSRQQMENDLRKMKSYNINAIHTTKYSPMEPYFYELCDRFGFYVVADANLTPVSTRKQVVATDKDFIPLFEQRVENLYGKYKNYSSIVAWSLGNTTDNGVCMSAAYRRLKALDKSRPVIFAASGHGEFTDVIALHTPTAKALSQTLKKVDSRPIVMLTMATMDNFSSLDDLWNTVHNNRTVQGGFVEGWPLAETYLADLRQLYSPLEVSISKITRDDGEFTIHNSNDFASFAGYTLDYTIYTNLRSNVIAGDLPVAIPAGMSEKVSMRLPELDMQAGEEMFVRFNLTAKPNAINKNKVEAGTAVFSLQKTASVEKHPLAIIDDRIPSLQEVPRVRLSFDGHQDWDAMLTDSILEHPAGGVTAMLAMWRFVNADGVAMCDVRTTTTLFSTGDCLIDYDIRPTSWQRGQLQPVLNIEYMGDSVAWFGPDRDVVLKHYNTAMIGTYSAPLRNMERHQIRWCAIYNAVGGLMARLKEQPCDMRVEDSILLIYPNQKTFQLHVCPYTEGTMADVFATEYPSYTVDMLEPPTISSTASRFSQAMKIVIETSQKGQIRYTTDGTDPTENSPIYTTPFEISTSTTVKARLYVKGKSPSFITTRRFNYDYIVSTTFSRRANTPYNVGSDTILFDGVMGDLSNLMQGWLGFSGKAPEIVARLGKPLDVDYVSLRFVHSPDTWVFAPVAVNVSFSYDGDTYQNETTIECTFEPDNSEEVEARVVEMQIPAQHKAVVAVKIVPITIEHIPEWHRGKGLKPWLMTDEIIITEQ